MTMLASNTEQWHENEALRSHLITVVEQQKQSFLQLVQVFYDHGRQDKAQCLQLAKSIIQSVDNVVGAGDWQGSLFLKSTIKPLLQLREEAIAVRDELMREQGLLQIADYQVNDSQIKVYVSLYQANGDDLKAWEGQVASIRTYMAGRPVYKTEEDARKAIRQKLIQASEAYVVVAIAKDKLLTNDFSSRRQDRNGCELLTVEAGIVEDKDVIEFVHLDKHYRYFNNKLVLQEKKQASLWRARQEN